MKRLKVLIAFIMALMVSFSSTAMADQSNITKIDFVKMTLDLGKIEVAKKDDNVSYVESAFKNKILTGDMKTFEQEDSFVKEQAVIVLVRALGEEAIAKKMKDENVIKNMNDKDSISSWAKPYVIYAAKNGIIDPNANFNPKGMLSSNEAKDMVGSAKQFYDATLTKEGLTATKMLDESTKKLMSFKTYKLSGNMKTDGKTKTPQGEIPMDMNMTQEGFVQNPETVYIKSNMIMKTAAMEVKGITETYIKDRIMYIKEEGSEKWIKMDLNPIMAEMESLMGQSFNSGGVSKQQLELFGMYAKYEQDAIIDGKEYYVISMDIDKDSFKSIFKDIMNKLSDASLDMAQKQVPQDEQINEEEFKAEFEKMIKGMDIEIGYKMYISKTDKICDKTLITEKISMNMEQIVSEMILNGEFKYYDFDKEVKFPEIKESDIQQ